MPIRDSKLALREAAELLGANDKAARAYMRSVQALVGWPVPYRAIVEAMRESPSTDAETVARAAAERAGAEPPA